MLLICCYNWLRKQKASSNFYAYSCHLIAGHTMPSKGTEAELFHQFSVWLTYMFCCSQVKRKAEEEAEADDSEDDTPEPGNLLRQVISIHHDKGLAMHLRLVKKGRGKLILDS